MPKITAHVEMPHDIPTPPTRGVEPPSVPTTAKAPIQAPDVGIPHVPSSALPDVSSAKQGFQTKATELAGQVQNAGIWSRLTGAKAELQRQQKLYAEAAEHVSTPEQATLADALLKLPKKNQPPSIKQALDMTKAGDALLPQIMQGTLPAGHVPTKAQVAQIQWSLYNKAVQQLESQPRPVGTPREQLIGGMTVLDDGGKIAQFMQGVPRTGTGTGSYTRPSSHFQTNRDTSLGMDFTDEATPLPAGKKTTLYGTKDGGFNSYLKNEYSGYDSWTDRLGHIADFFKTNILGQRDVGRREKFIPKDVKEQYSAMGGPPLTSKEEAKQLKAYGIAYMLEKLPADQRQEFATYVSNRGYNNPEMRKGEEIIIPQSQLSG